MCVPSVNGLQHTSLCICVCVCALIIDKRAAGKRKVRVSWTHIDHRLRKRSRLCLREGKSFYLEIIKKNKIHARLIKKQRDERILLRNCFCSLFTQQTIKNQLHTILKNKTRDWLHQVLNNNGRKKLIN